MKDENKTKAELIKELKTLRKVRGGVNERPHHTQAGGGRSTQE